MRSNESHERDDRWEVGCPKCFTWQDTTVDHCPNCGINVKKALRPKKKKKGRPKIDTSRTSESST